MLFRTLGTDKRSQQAKTIKVSENVYQFAVCFIAGGAVFPSYET